MTRTQLEMRKILLENYLQKILVSKDEDPTGTLEEIALYTLALVGMRNLKKVGNLSPWQFFDIDDRETWPHGGPFLVKCPAFYDIKPSFDSHQWASQGISFYQRITPPEGK